MRRVSPGAVVVSVVVIQSIQHGLSGGVNGEPTLCDASSSVSPDSRAMVAGSPV